MKIKLSLTIIILLIFNANSFAQMATLIENFKPAFSKGAVDWYINEANYLVDNLIAEEKPKGERILTLFKVLTGREQDMATTAFNKAMYDVDLTGVLEKDLNTDLTLLRIKIGKFSSHVVYNNGKKYYKFSLKGLFKTPTRSATNKFDGGIMGYRCRSVNYGDTPYRYSVVSVAEIPTPF